MSVYESAAAAYRDTTKWLAAFLPVTAIVSAAVVAGGPLVNSVRTSPSPDAWLEDYWLVVVCGSVIFAAIAWVLNAGAKVLSVEPVDIGELSTPEKATHVANAIGSGVAAPEFFDKASFDRAMAELANGWDAGDVKPDDPRLTRLRGPIEALRQWSLLQGIRTPYRDFRIAFVVSSVAVCVAVIALPAQLKPSGAIDKPTPVEVEVSYAGAADLASSTGCSDPDATKFTAVGGTWSSPQLAVDGAGCAFGATWRPSETQVEVRLPPPAE